MLIQFKNNATGTLASGIVAADTTIVLTGGHGAYFPTLTGSQYFYATLKDSLNNLEIVKVTARSGDSLTVTRAQEGTSSQATNDAGDTFEIRPTAAGLEAIYDEASGPAAINAGTSKATPVDADELPLYDSAATTTKKKLTWANLKATLGSTFAALAGSVSQAFSAASIELGHASDTTLARVSAGVVSVEGNTVAMLAATETFSAPQRGTQTTDNDLSFDLNATNNFKCTPTAGGALTFTNIPTGQTGSILLVNGSNYAITAAATTKVGTSTLTTISATGTYLLSYYADGTNVYVVNSGALA